MKKTDKILDWPSRLTTWYNERKRTLPWRNQPTPYRVWISEIMLQQTRVETVIPYFLKFVNRFPDPVTLAEADIQDVLLLWQGLGYYSRVRNLHRAAQRIAEEFGGYLPKTYSELLHLPGFGVYTAAAVASIAYGEAVPVVDGNVLRVWSRFAGLEDDVKRQSVRDRVFRELIPAIVQSEDPSSFNQGMMELGALVCKPRNPSCPDCPLAQRCFAFREHRTDSLPVRSVKPAAPRVHVVVAILEKDGQFLITRRKTGGMLGGLWEFPGGACRNDRKMKSFLAEKVKAETGYTVNAGREIGLVLHAFSHFTVQLHIFPCRILEGSMHPAPIQSLAWVSLEDMDKYPFPSLNRKVIRILQTRRLQ